MLFTVCHLVHLSTEASTVTCRHRMYQQVNATTCRHLNFIHCKVIFVVLRACFLTSSLVAMLSLTLTIPMTTIADIILKQDVSVTL